MAGVVGECEARGGERRGVFCCEAGGAYTSWYRRHTWELERAALKQQQQEAQAAVAAPAASERDEEGRAKQTPS